MENVQKMTEKEIKIKYEILTLDVCAQDCPFNDEDSWKCNLSGEDLDSVCVEDERYGIRTPNCNEIIECYEKVKKKKKE